MNELMRKLFPGLLGLTWLLIAACANSPTLVPTVTPSETEASYTIGIARWVTNDEYDRNVDAFKAALADSDLIEGANVTYLEKNPGADSDKQRAIIQDFVKADVDLIYSLTTPGTLIAKELAPDIPIVFSIVTFPVEVGLIESMAASGNNLVGTSNWIPIDKQLFALKSVAPEVKTIGFVHRAGEPNSTIQFNLMLGVGDDLGLEVLQVAPTSLTAAEEELEAAAPEVDAFFLACDTMIQGGGEEVVIQVARKYQLPTLSCNKSSVFKGALVGDVADFANIGALAGEKAVQVLNGTHPSNLISETQRGSYLMVNRSTANHLELSISDSLLSQPTPSPT